MVALLEAAQAAQGVERQYSRTSVGFIADPTKEENDISDHFTHRCYACASMSDGAAYNGAWRSVALPVMVSGVSVAVATTCTNPLDVLKVRLQVAQPGPAAGSSRTITHTLAHLCRNEVEEKPLHLSTRHRGRKVYLQLYHWVLVVSAKTES